MPHQQSLYHQLESELSLIPNNTIAMNGGFYEHYTKHPGQFTFAFLSLLSGVSTGLLSVPSIMALSHLDHDSSNKAIFAQHPGLMIMGFCSAVAQANFLMADFVRVHGQVYQADHKCLSLLHDTQQAFLSSLDLVSLSPDALDDAKFIDVFDQQLHKIAHQKIIELINLRKTTGKVQKQALSDWFDDFNLAQWRNELVNKVSDINTFDDRLYLEFDERIAFVWKTYYEPFQAALFEVLQNILAKESTLDQKVVGIIQAMLNEFMGEEHEVFKSEIKKLYEPLMHDDEGYYIENQAIIKHSKQVGVFVSYLNVAVNVLIGLGAFFALGQFIYWLGGGTLAIFTATGALGWSIKIAFAGLCAIGSYLVTRLDIQEAFNNFGYRMTLWLKNKHKWHDLWQAMKKPRNIFTIAATLPAAIGIGIINALGFYLAFPATPLVLALAIVVFLSTMIAITTMMGKRLYASYPRWRYYFADLYKRRVPIMMNLAVVGAIVTVFVMNAHYIPILFAFWTITPFSSFLLIACAATVVFALLMSATKQWRWHVSMKGSIGSICVFASMVTVFTALLPIVGAGLAGFIAIASSILFFSFYVSSVMVHETDERKFIVARDLSTKTSEVPSSNLFTDHAIDYATNVVTGSESSDDEESLLLVPTTGLSSGREADRL